MEDGRVGGEGSRSGDGIMKICSTVGSISRSVFVAAVVSIFLFCEGCGTSPTPTRNDHDLVPMLVCVPGFNVGVVCKRADEATHLVLKPTLSLRLTKIYEFTDESNNALAQRIVVPEDSVSIHIQKHSTVLAKDSDGNISNIGQIIGWKLPEADREGFQGRLVLEAATQDIDIFQTGLQLKVVRGGIDRVHIQVVRDQSGCAESSERANERPAQK